MYMSQQTDVRILYTRQQTEDFVYINVCAYFPGWFSIVPPDRKSLSSPRLWQYACVRWTLKWAHRCTSNKISHTLPVCQEERGWKKKSFLCILVECTLIYPLSLHLFFHLPLKSAARLRRFSLHINAKQLSGSAAWAASQVVAYKRCCDRERETVSCTDACRHYTQFQMSPPQSVTVTVSKREPGWGGGVY